MERYNLRGGERGGEQHHGEAGVGDHGEQRRDQHVEQHVAGQRGEDHLYTRGLGQGTRRKHDQLQGEDDQAEADEGATEAPDLG